MGPLDHDATDALAEVITVAVAAGSVAVIDLSDDATAERPTMPTRTQHPHRLTAPAATAVDAGLLRLATASTPWTVDVAARKLSRNAPLTDRCSTPPHAWCSIASITISGRALIAITDQGVHLEATGAIQPAGAWG
jgi:hypothetical protein